MKEMLIPGEVWLKGLECFGSEQDLIEWLQKENDALDGDSPGDYILKNFSGDLHILKLMETDN